MQPEPSLDANPSAGARRSIAAVAGAVLCAAAQVAAAQSPGVPTHDGLHDFDFVIGHWNVHLRKLLHPLTGSTEWVEYEGTSVMTKIWDDRANMEDFKVTSLDKRLHMDAQTLRLYNPETHQWSIYLAYAAKGQLPMPPVVGSFKDGRGEFFDAENFDGRAIIVRYVWTHPRRRPRTWNSRFRPTGVAAGKSTGSATSRRGREPPGGPRYFRRLVDFHPARTSSSNRRLRHGENCTTAGSSSPPAR